MVLGTNRVAQFRWSESDGLRIWIYQNGNRKAKARFVKEIIFAGSTSTRARSLCNPGFWTTSPDGQWMLGSARYWPSDQFWSLIDTRTGSIKSKVRPKLDHLGRAFQSWTSASTFLEVRTEQVGGIQIAEYRVPDLKRIGSWSVPTEKDWFNLVGMRNRNVLLWTRNFEERRFILKAIPLPESEGVEPSPATPVVPDISWIETDRRHIMDAVASPNGKWIAWITEEIEPGSYGLGTSETKAPRKSPERGPIGRIEVTDSFGKSPRILHQARGQVYRSVPVGPFGVLGWFPSGDRISFSTADGYFSIPFTAPAKSPQ